MVLVLSPLVFFSLAIAACDAGSSAMGSDTTRVTGPATTISFPGSTNVSSSPEAEVFFPELKEAQLTPLLPLIGKLIVGRKGCIRGNDPTFDQGDRGYIPLWPPQDELDADGDDARIPDGRGQIVARVGEEVNMRR
jgi:hypothetical protein